MNLDEKRGSFFQKRRGGGRGEITLLRFNDNFLGFPFASRATDLLPEAPASRVHGLALSPSSRDGLVPRHPHPSAFSHAVWALKTLGSDRRTELSFKPATHRRWHPQPHSRAPWQRLQSWHCFHCLRKKEPKADGQHKSRPNMDRE